MKGDEPYESLDPEVQEREDELSQLRRRIEELEVCATQAMLELRIEHSERVIAKAQAATIEIERNSLRESVTALDQENNSLRRELSDAKACAESAERQREIVASALGKIALERDELLSVKQHLYGVISDREKCLEARRQEIRILRQSRARLVKLVRAAQSHHLELYHELQAQYEQEHVICEAATDNMIHDRLHRIPALEAHVKALSQSAREVFNQLVMDDTYQYGYVMDCGRMYTAAKRLEEILNATPDVKPSGVLKAASEVIEAFRRLGKCEDEFGSTSGYCGEYADALDTRILALETALRAQYPCPGCGGQKYDKGNCALCGNLGYMLPAQRADMLTQLQATGATPNVQR